jgi:hypothetical protein
VSTTLYHTSYHMRKGSGVKYLYLLTPDNLSTLRRSSSAGLLITRLKVRFLPRSPTFLATYRLPRFPDLPALWTTLRFFVVRFAAFRVWE